MLAQLEDSIVPLATILSALPTLIGKNPERATVRKWRERKRLVPAGVDAFGVELYRGGDVIGLARDDSRRPGPKRRERTAAG